MDGRRETPSARLICFFLEEGMLQDGENELVAEVTNTLAKAHHDNVFDRYWVQEPTGLLGPVKVEYME